MPKVLLSQPLPKSTVAQLSQIIGAKTTFGAVTSMDEEEFALLSADAEVLLTAFRKVDAKLLALAPQVRFIQQMGVGYDNLNLDDIAKAGVMAAYVPGVNTEGVAEHTILLMLTTLKRFSEAESNTRANKWEGMSLSLAGIGDLSTATVGLVGFGAIAQATAARLKPFGTTLLYTSRHQADAQVEAQLGVRYLPLSDLLAASDLVSLHLPLSKDTRHFIGAAQLAQMKPGAILINTARGGLVDESALRQALVSGHIAGAGLDVLEQEKAGGNSFADLPQVLVTPHTAGLSRASTTKLFQMVIANVERYLSGQKPLNLLN